jgi:hypothetical protein
MPEDFSGYGTFRTFALVPWMSAIEEPSASTIQIEVVLSAISGPTYVAIARLLLLGRISPSSG